MCVCIKEERNQCNAVCIINVYICACVIIKILAHTASSAVNCGYARVAIRELTPCKRLVDTKTTGRISEAIWSTYIQYTK